MLIYLIGAKYGESNVMFCAILYAHPGLGPAAKIIGTEQKFF